MASLCAIEIGGNPAYEIGKKENDAVIVIQVF